MKKIFIIYVITTGLYAVNPIQRITQSTGFEENLGQIRDLKNKPVKNVLFRAKLKNFSVFITDKGVSYVIYGIKKYRNTDKNNKFREENDKNLINYARIDIELLNSCIKKQNIEYEKEIPGYSNYYFSSFPDGILFVNSYKKIRIKNIYPGIDWIWKIEGNRLHHEFEIKPNADISNIKLKVKWANVEIKEGGKKIVFKNSLAHIEDGEIYAYKKLKNGKEVLQIYYRKTKNNIIGFEVKGFTGKDTVIIDPPLSLLWSTYYGGSDVDRVTSVTTDEFGNLFVAGYTLSTDFPVHTSDTGAYFQDTLTGNYDIFILKFSPNGERLWATYYGGSLDDYTYSIATDQSGNILLTGKTESTDLPLYNPGTGAYFQGNYGGGLLDAFILKFSNTGKRLWATYYGGSGTDNGESVDISSSGDIFITGHTLSTDFPVYDPGTGAYFQATNKGSYDLFILRFTNEGVRLWATYYGGLNYDKGYSIKVDNTNNVFFITGFTASADFPVYNPGGAYFQGTYAGNEDIFILKFNITGERLWATYYGGGSYDKGYSVTTDIYGNVFLTGVTASTNFPVYDPGGGTYFQGNNAGNDDAFILKFSNSGQQLWATYYGGSGDDNIRTTPYITNIITTDLNANLIITGKTNSSDFPLYNPGNGAYFDSTYTGNGSTQDIFISMFSNTGIPMWSTYFGGYSSDIPRAITTDSKGNIFIAGETGSGDFPLLNPGNNTYFQETLKGAYDAFITKFQTPLAPFPFNLISPQDSFIFSIPPTLIWQKTSATYGINHYSIIIDSIERAQSVDTMWTLNYTPSEGFHKWFIIAYDDSVSSPTVSNNTFTFGFDTTGPFIDSTTTWTDTSFSGPFEVETKITDNFAGTDSVFLFYKRDSDTNWIKSNMLLLDTTLSRFLDTIPPVYSPSETIRYYIKSFDKSSPQNVSTDPPGAPSVYYSFVANLLGIKENIKRPERFFFSIKNTSKKEIIFFIYLPEKSKISLKIYSITGRLIASPLNKTYLPGIYTIKFSPKVKGIYFYKLKSPFLNKNGKLIIF